MRQHGYEYDGVRSPNRVSNHTGEINFAYFTAYMKWNQQQKQRMKGIKS